MKKVLIVGGTGALGGHAANFLAHKGYDIAISARTPAPSETFMASLPFIEGDYVAGDFTPQKLEGFDGIIFAAGNDPRHIPRGTDSHEHLHKANVEAIPAFVRAARDAGVTRFIQLGSYYPQAAPELETNNRYILTRRLACEAARAETRDGFAVLSVNAPFMVGAVPGLRSKLFEPLVSWAEGNLPMPYFGPAGGTNFMSFRSLSQALEGALLRGEPGKAYLVGDENLSFAAFFDLFFKAVGSEIAIEPRDEAHPMMPDVAIPQGRGNYISYEPDAAEAALLSYDRDDVANAVAELVDQFGKAHAHAA